MTIYEDITRNIVNNEYSVTSYVLDVNNEAACYIFINKGYSNTPYLRAIQIMYEINVIDIVNDDSYNEMPTFIGPDKDNKYHFKNWEDKPDIKHVYAIRYNNTDNTYEFEQVDGVLVSPINYFVEQIFDNLEQIVQEHEEKKQKQDRINRYKNQIDGLNEDERKRLVSAVLKTISKRKDE